MDREGFNFLLQDFCDYCSHFIPELERIPLKVKWGELPAVINNVRCENRLKCARIAEYFTKLNRKEGTKNDNLE